MNNQASNSATHQRTQAPLVLLKTKDAYREWHTHLVHISRIDRNTIGVRIDEIFLSLCEFIFRACFAGDRFEKISAVSNAIAKSDILKFLLEMAWEEKIIDHKHYGKLLLDLDEIGRMLGGWKRTLSNKTPTK
ncbi:MAG: four helix bundle protein [Patescibacteria group bacterium]